MEMQQPFFGDEAETTGNKEMLAQTSSYQQPLSSGLLNTYEKQSPLCLSHYLSSFLLPVPKYVIK